MDPAGTTLGVEEEYHLVDPGTFDLLPQPELSRRASDGWAGPRLHAEMLTSQLEAVTGICTELDELRASVRAARADAATAAAGYGATILASSTHPFASLAQVDIAARPRYQALLHRFGGIVRQLNLTGYHVHVGVPDVEVAVAVMNHVRPYLPTLAALTGSSAFHEGADTGFDSFRTSQLALWPQGGPPPLLESAQHYRDVVARLIDMDLVDEASMVLWELRPSDRYPTLEFRLADVCTDVDDVVLFAGLVRSLVRVLAARVQSDTAVVAVDEITLRTARWRAARFGLSGELWSFKRNTLVPAALAVAELWNVVREDLAAHGEEAVLRRLLDRLLRHGTSATRQRRTFAATGSLREVARAGVELTLREVTSVRRASATTAPGSPRP